MTFQKQYSKSTLKKALCWLDKQDHGWSQHVKDSQVAVQMYLKSNKKEEEEENSFQEELKSFLNEDLGAVSTDFNRSPPAKKRTQPPQQTQAFLEASSLKDNSFCLDKKSLESLELVRKELNIQSREEALRLIIQLGERNLKGL